MHRLAVAAPIASIGLLLLLTPQAAYGQGVYADGGTKSYGSFHESDIARVNLYTRTLDIRIPLTSYPQRGGKLKAGYVFVMPQLRFIRIINPSSGSDPRCNNSDPTQACYVYQQDTFSYQGIGGILGNAGIIGDFGIWHDYDPNGPISGNQTYTPGRLREADGTVHALYSISSTQAVTIDGTGWLVQPIKWQDSGLPPAFVHVRIRQLSSVPSPV